MDSGNVIEPNVSFSACSQGPWLSFNSPSMLSLGLFRHRFCMLYADAIAWATCDPELKNLASRYSASNSSQTREVVCWLVLSVCGTLANVPANIVNNRLRLKHGFDHGSHLPEDDFHCAVRHYQERRRRGWRTRPSGKPSFGGPAGGWNIFRLNNMSSFVSCRARPICGEYE
jgi:hypothetical protein